MTELDDALELGQAVQRLRILYEQYFAGVERFEPLKERGRVKKELRRLMSVRSNNTAYKFRMQTLQASFVTHETHWDRIARQIEEGTFKRDKLKAQRHLAAMLDVTNDVELIEDIPEEIDAYEELDAGDALASLEADDGSAIQELLGKGLLRNAPAKPAGATAGTANATAIPAAAETARAARSLMEAEDIPTPVPSEARGVARAAVAPLAIAKATADSSTPSAIASAPRPTATVPAPKPAAAPARASAPTPTPDADLKKLHEAFIAARSQTGETRPVSMETLAETIRKQSATVKAQLGCEKVEFKVAIKDGKAVLKAIPK